MQSASTMTDERLDTLLKNKTPVGTGVKGCRGNNCVQNPEPSTVRGKRRRERKKNNG